MPHLRLPCAQTNESSPQASPEEQAPSSSLAAGHQERNPTTEAARTIATQGARRGGRARAPAALNVIPQTFLPRLSSPETSANTPSSPRISAALASTELDLSATQMADLMNLLEWLLARQKQIKQDPLLTPSPVILTLKTPELNYLTKINYSFNNLHINQLHCTNGQLRSEHIPVLPRTLEIIDFSNNPKLGINWLWEKVMSYTKPIYIDMSGTKWAAKLIQERQKAQKVFSDFHKEVLKSTSNHDGMAFNIAEFAMLYQKSPDNFPSLSGTLQQLAQHHRRGDNINLRIQIRFAWPGTEELPNLNALQLR